MGPCDLPRGVLAEAKRTQTSTVLPGEGGASLRPAQGSRLSGDLAAVQRAGGGGAGGGESPCRAAGAGPAEDGPGRTPVVVVLREGVVRRLEEVFAATGLGPAGVRPTRVWRRAIEGFAAELTRTEIGALAADPSVERIELDRTVRAHGPRAMYWVGIEKARVDFRVTGNRDSVPAVYSTRDIVIAVLDTGIDTGHVDLAGKVVGWHDVIAGSPEPYDDHGHGTWTSSIAVGAGAGKAAYRGAAPEAALVGVKVLDASGSGTLSQVISGVEWLIENKDDLNIRVGNMSLGATGSSDGRDALSLAVDQAVEAGIVMCVSAGNGGPQTYTISTPAASRKAVTVGAVIDPSSRGWALAPFSSRGPTADGRVKPDLCLPGVEITGALAGTRAAYATYSGTSASAPMAAGLAGLMLCVRPGLTPAEVKAILAAASSVKDFGPPGPDVDFGAGIANGHEDVRRAGGFTRTWNDGLSFIYRSGSLPRTGASRTWTFTVGSTSRPVGVTMVIRDWVPWRDFDLYLYDPTGRLVAYSLGVDRQETITYAPKARGPYRLVVYAYAGSGSYWLNVSYR